MGGERKKFSPIFFISAIISLWLIQARLVHENAFLLLRGSATSYVDKNTINNT